MSSQKSLFAFACLAVSLSVAMPSPSLAINCNTVKAPEDYLIGAEDVLEVSVWKEPELQRKLSVRPDGKITFPLAGEIAAAGATTEQVQEEITRRIKKYIPDALVTVTVADVKGYKIYVNGQVKKPGEYRPKNYVDVLQALTLAGGLTAFAKDKKIRIQRHQEDGSIGECPFNYSDVANGRNPLQNIILMTGDTVIVP